MLPVTFTFLSLPNTLILAPFGTDNPFSECASVIRCKCWSYRKLGPPCRMLGNIAPDG
jgi:hypothetical protein